MAASFSRTSLRNRHERTSTARRKLGRQATQRVPSREMPPPGTIIWTCGWWVIAEASTSSAPGVQDREDPDAGAEVFGIGRDGEHGLGRSLEQDAVDCGLVLVGYIGDLSRQREHDVEVRHRQEFGLALGQPLARRRSLALRTVPIATGVVGDLRVTALLVLAARNMPAEGRRAAALDRTHDLHLVEADVSGVGSAPRRPVVAEDIRDL